MKRPIYLDHQSTTPLDPRVLEAMQPYLTWDFGNASSSQHAYGWAAKSAVDRARKEVATLIGAAPREIVFTSGATESINTVFHSLIAKRRKQPVHVITTAVEHAATLRAAEMAAEWGVEVTNLPVDSFGRVDASAIGNAIKRHTLLISVIHGNNEIGSLNPVAEIAQVAKDAGVALHLDMCQTAGKVPIDLGTLPADFASLSAHKIYGPKGVGALFIRKPLTHRLDMVPLLVGGSSEGGLRAGTANVAGIVGFGKAATLAHAEMTSSATEIESLRRHFIEALTSLQGVRFNGHPDNRIPGLISMTIENVHTGDLYPYLKDIAVSTGSACASANSQPSHVLTAIGLSFDQAHSTFRIGLGKGTTNEQIDLAIQQFTTGIQKLRAASPVENRAIL